MPSFRFSFVRFARVYNLNGLLYQQDHVWVVTLAPQRWRWSAVPYGPGCIWCLTPQPPLLRRGGLYFCLFSPHCLRQCGENQMLMVGVWITSLAAQSEIYRSVI